MGNYDLNSSSWILSARQTRKNLPVWNTSLFKPIGFLGLHCLIHKVLHPLEIALINSVCLVPSKLVLLPFPLLLFFPSCVTKLSLLVLSSVLLFLVFSHLQRPVASLYCLWFTVFSYSMCSFHMLFRYLFLSLASLILQCLILHFFLCELKTWTLQLFTKYT